MLSEADLIDRLLETTMENGRLRERLERLERAESGTALLLSQRARLREDIDTILSRNLENSKIQLIKICKNLYNTDLKTAKDMVENSVLWCSRAF